ncbi:alpha/beta hydrolase [Mesobacillus jeotgali]|uniref:alpha/beta hydrolase n=1 Tax=Mesobacillus jeotgali TaxID=129985 RepID=UPI002227803C|nr:alpha/beta hydrolase [Mesobacillus jeotgali]UYZ21706.1 alpha/beta hydrolase [Mesobacillus jeotgali]
MLEGVRSRDDWNRKRESIQRKWLSCIGGLPRLVDMSMTIDSWAANEDHYLIKIRYSSVYDDWVTANLLIPKLHDAHITNDEEVQVMLFSGRGFSEKAFPAILALHPTSETGKDDISLSTGRMNRQYGLELVKRGYVVLAPDTVTAGERILDDDKPFHTASFYQKHPEWSAVAKMIIDHQQGISLLQAFKLVDPERIGVIGHSLGGYNAYFLAGADQRVKAVVCSCGFSPLADDPETHRWGRREWFSHIPKLSDDIAQGKTPFEFNEIAALAASTPLFMWMAKMIGSSLIGSRQQRVSQTCILYMNGWERKGNSLP